MNQLATSPESPKGELAAPDTYFDYLLSKFNPAIQRLAISRDEEEKVVQSAREVTIMVRKMDNNRLNSSPSDKVLPFGPEKMGLFELLYPIVDQASLYLIIEFFLRRDIYNEVKESILVDNYFLKKDAGEIIKKTFAPLLELSEPVRDLIRTSLVKLKHLSFKEIIQIVNVAKYFDQKGQIELFTDWLQIVIGETKINHKNFSLDPQQAYEETISLGGFGVHKAGASMIIHDLNERMNNCPENTEFPDIHITSKPSTEGVGPKPLAGPEKPHHCINIATIIQNLEQKDLSPETIEDILKLPSQHKQLGSFIESVLMNYRNITRNFTGGVPNLVEFVSKHIPLEASHFLHYSLGTKNIESFLDIAKKLNEKYGADTCIEYCYYIDSNPTALKLLDDDTEEFQKVFDQFSEFVQPYKAKEDSTSVPTGFSVSHIARIYFNDPQLFTGQETKILSGLKKILFHEYDTVDPEEEMDDLYDGGPIAKAFSAYLELIPNHKEEMDDWFTVAEMLIMLSSVKKHKHSSNHALIARHGDVENWDDVTDEVIANNSRMHNEPVWKLTGWLEDGINAHVAFAYLIQNMLTSGNEQFEQIAQEMDRRLQINTPFNSEELNRISQVRDIRSLTHMTRYTDHDFDFLLRCAKILNKPGATLDDIEALLVKFEDMLKKEGVRELLGEHCIGFVKRIREYCEKQGRMHPIRMRQTFRSRFAGLVGMHLHRRPPDTSHTPFIVGAMTLVHSMARSGKSYEDMHQIYKPMGEETHTTSSWVRDDNAAINGFCETQLPSLREDMAIMGPAFIRQIISSRLEFAGLLPIGVKIHTHNDMDEKKLEALQNTFGLSNTPFRLIHANRSLILPPLPSSTEMIMFIMSLAALGIIDMDKPEIQVAVAGRWHNKRAAVVGAAILLATDRGVIYEEGAFDTTHNDETGSRIMAYDAGVRKEGFPFDIDADGRTDMLGRRSVTDIKNYQFLGTLATHKQYGGPLADLWDKFEKEFIEILRKYNLEETLWDSAWIFRSNTYFEKDYHEPRKCPDTQKNHEKMIRKFCEAWMDSLEKDENHELIISVQQLIQAMLYEFHDRQPALIEKRKEDIDNLIYF